VGGGLSLRSNIGTGRHLLDPVLFQNSADARIESLQDVRMTSALRSRLARHLLELADERVSKVGQGERAPAKPLYMFAYMFGFADLVKSWDDFPQNNELSGRNTRKQRKWGCFQGALGAGGPRFKSGRPD